MASFSYTISDQLKESLRQVDEGRKNLLLTPIPPEKELGIRWETTIDRIYYSLILSGIESTREYIFKTLSQSILKKPKNLSSEQKTILKYKKALDLIANNWIASENIITPRTVIALHSVGAVGTYRKKEAELKQIVDYIQQGKDHPVVQAAVVYAALSQLNGFSDGNGRLARLISLLFLYKAGYVLRGFIAIEKEWYQNQEEFKDALNQGINNAHMTRWIEYYSQSIANQLAERLAEIQTTDSVQTRVSNFSSLNDRQKEILTILEEPNLTITNRKVQKYFNISQITASRDLSKLAILGLLAPRGRGRSVNYTKV